MANLLLLVFFYLKGVEAFGASLSSSGGGGDTSALVEFHKGLEGDPQGCLAESWAVSEAGPGCPRSWCGVTCDTGGNVVSLVLPSMSLSGEIRPGSLGRLLKLNILILSANSLSGSLPDDLGRLPSLAHLDLSHNLFNGTIPISLGGLTSLLNLSLASNCFDGAIPPSLASLPSLQSLNLSINHLSGAIPKDLAAIRSLTTLDLHSNQLSGSIDPALLSFPALAIVDLSSNLLAGEIPWLQPLPLEYLKLVNLSNNRLTGVLVQDKMSVLFTEQLTVLDLSGNQLAGELPSFEFLYSLQVLRMSRNAFSGAIPSSLLTTMQVLEELDLSSNNLNGGIPSITSTTLKVLNLSFNALDSTVPTRLGRCTSVDISNNKLFGSLSAMHGWADSLVYLDLSNNNLSGPLPDESIRFVRLSYLNLSRNTLSGLIPPDFGLFPKLTVIDMGFNELNGALPLSLFNSSSLSYLTLSNNKFTGDLPLYYPSNSSSRLPQLVLLDLSSNRLNGGIPEDIGGLLMLEVLDLSRNQFTGTIPSELGNLTALKKLDLSNNQLSGFIPITLPQSLLELNLTYNELSGTIPPSLNRFPLTSFFPGNPELHSINPGISSNAPQFDHGGSNHTGFPVPVIAGLIGGGIAGLALIVAVCCLIHYRKQSRAVNYGSGSEFSVTDKKLGGDMKARDPASMLGGDGVVMGDRKSPPMPPTGDSFLQDVVVHDGSSLSPLRPKQTLSLGAIERAEGSQTSEVLAGESPYILNVQSPELLAGVLHFLDHSLAFTAEELSRAPAEVLGRSSHGTSYKATLGSGHVLTVKWLKEGLAKSKDEFAREAKKFGKIRHPNIVSLRAYYWGPREHEKLILSDYIGPGSLAAHLNGRRFPTLSWPQRLRIAVDIARGLVYLHCDRNVAHGNLKATNVLLDALNLNARLGDYGLHLLMTSEGTANQILNAGALGYRAPELALLRKPQPSLKGDIYAFGVTMMELLTGKSAGDIISGHCGAVDLTDWVRMLASEGRSFECYDSALVGPESESKAPKGMDDMLALALKCTSLQSSRPNIRTVYGELASLST